MNRRLEAALPALALALLGCAQIRAVSGPRFGDLEPGRRTTALTELEIADHRTRDQLRFLVFGDAGIGAGAQSRVARLMEEVCETAGGCDFALVTGDLIYPTGVRHTSDPKFDTHFEEPYAGFGRFDFWLVTGNHDWYRRGSVQAELAYTLQSPRWRMPALDYAVPLLPPWISIYGLDTTLIEAGRETGQIERAKGALCDAPGWRLLFGHHGLYTIGYHGDRSGVIQPLEEAVLGPLIRSCGVDLYLAGHDHLQAHVATADFDQITQGAGGRRLHREKRRAERPAGLEVHAVRDDDFGFAVIEATPENATISFYSLRDQGKPFYTTELRREH